MKLQVAVMTQSESRCGFMSPYVGMNDLTKGDLWKQ